MSIFGKRAGFGSRTKRIRKERQWKERVMVRPSRAYLSIFSFDSQLTAST
jgi:hypothetical protein